MRRYLLSFVFCLLTLSVAIFCPATLLAWNSPVPIPDLGNARLRVVGQNVENYLSNIDASNSSCHSQAQFEAKTNKIANAFLALQADIVAICEVQADDEILGYIVDAMNTIVGGNDYDYITDGIYVPEADAGEYQSLKAGFIFKVGTVQPVGNNTSPYRSGEYFRRMRVQAFKELATDEMFVLSMNHFKAKSSGADQGENTRIQNASTLITALQQITVDPDILIMGDLNAYMGETPINNLENAGFTEQLTRFDPAAYTYIYHGEEGILDHCMANASMAEQITGAYAYHINTAGGYNYEYSDHDAVLVGLRLGAQSGEGIEVIDATLPAHKILRDGQLFIVVEGQVFTITGTRIE